MNRTMKQLGAFLLSLILLLSLAACGTTGTSKDTGAAKEATTGQQNTVPATTPPEGPEADTQEQSNNTAP